MRPNAYRTPDGVGVPAVTADEMRDVDRIATEDLGLSLAQMVEHAGRTLARHALEFDDGPTVVLAGGGGNGSGGLACARHLGNRGRSVTVVLDRDPVDLEGVAATQHGILDAMDVPIWTDADEASDPSLVVDALVGYGLEGTPRGTAASLVEWVNRSGADVLALDVPTGTNATTGETPGVAIDPDRTLTLALPKTGLGETASELYLGDVSVPPLVYDRLEIPSVVPFGRAFSVALERVRE